MLDDDRRSIEKYARALEYQGFDVSITESVEEALDVVSRIEVSLAIIDLSIPTSIFETTSTDGGSKTGLAFAAHLGKIGQSFPVILLSHYYLEVEIDAESMSALGVTRVLGKDTSAAFLCRCVRRALDKSSYTPQSFIVHGHGKEVISELKEIIVGDLGWEEPIILKEKSSGGQTIIEKFEIYSTEAEVVFVLLTPDDIGSSRKTMGDDTFRARQNVLFELGYFFGRLHRKTGRIIVICQESIEIPSDLWGLEILQFKDSVRECLDEIKRETREI